MIFFKPNGSLNIATDPSDLPESTDGNNITSDALTRFKNLRSDQKGVTKLRDGSSKLHVSAIDTAIWLLVEQGGNRYAFAGTSIYRNESSIASSLTNAQWSAIRYNQFNDTDQQIFALNGTDRKRINGTTVAEWGIAAPTVVPTVAVGVGTGLTGAYLAKYTYCRKVGSVVVSESNPSAASASQTLANQALRVTWTASSDTQVTHVRVYRTLTGGLIYNHDQDVAIGTTTVDTNTADSALGDPVEIDHDRPPLGSFVIGPTFDGMCFIIFNNFLYYCKARQPEYWPSASNIEIGPPQAPGRCAVIFNGQVFVLTKNEIVNIIGTGDGTFLPISMKARTGAQGIFGAYSVAGYGIFHTGQDGVYLFAGGQDKNFTDSAFAPIFRGETVQGLPGVSEMGTAWLHAYGKNLYFGYTSTGNSYPSNVLVLNIDTGKVVYHVYNDGSEIQIRCITTDETNSRIIVGDSTGFIRKIEDKTVTTDSGTAISWEAQSKDFTLQTRAHFPRWNKFDVDASSSTTCNGYLLLDGSVHQTHTITGNRNTVRRLIKEGNGERCALRLSGSGPVSIYAVESE